jgi:hypothetical protein
MPTGCWRRIIHQVRTASFRLSPRHCSHRWFPGVGAYDVNLVAYYLPRSSIKVPLTLARGRQSWCEWKGLASYWTLTLGGDSVAGRIWSYENPTSGFEPIRSHVSLYAGPWDCFVDGEKVEPQPGDFYGGWVTSEVEGIVKGRTGNLDPVI